MRAIERPKRLTFRDGDGGRDLEVYWDNRGDPDDGIRRGLRLSQFVRELVPQALRKGRRAGPRAWAQEGRGDDSSGERRIRSAAYGDVRMGNSEAGRRLYAQGQLEDAGAGSRAQGKDRMTNKLFPHLILGNYIDDSRAH